MSVQDERELRERLGGLLDGIEARPAPVFRAMRQGRGIRMRRWVSIAAGVVVLAAGAVALPFVLQSPQATPPTAPRRFTVTVNPRSAHPPAGLIASGTEDGHRWTVVITGHGKSMSVGGASSVRAGLGTTLSDTIAHDPIVTSQWGGGGSDGTYTIFGLVSNTVTSVAIVMRGGPVLNLTPVSYDGQRYVGVVIPSQAPIVRAVAYYYGVERAYSIPYRQNQLETWVTGGLTAPARLTKTLSSGVTDGRSWRVAAQFGPWGYCFAWTNVTACYGVPTPQLLTAPNVVQEFTCGQLVLGNLKGLPMVGLAAARSDVRQVVLRLSGGSTERYVPVDVRIADVFAYLIPDHQRILTATAYNAAGAAVGTSNALGCP